MVTSSSRLLALALVVAAPLAACAPAGPGTTAGTSAATTVGDASGPTEDPREVLQVVASFYPLEYVVRRVAGDRAEISTLTAPGVDPHDVELTPRTVGSLGSADLVVYAAGLQPAVDDAVAAEAAEASLDVTTHADLLLLGETEDEHAEHAEEGHAEEDHAEDGHGHEGVDPHFWLDPQRYADVADAVAGRLAEIDPAGAEAYRANAETLGADLQALDEDLSAGLAQCRSREVVTTHEAFGYLGERYDLHLTGITGITPEAEPSPARLAEVTAQVRELGTTTIYTEPLLPSGIAETVARETGASVRTLDPVEGITDASEGEDYLEVMRANLESLRQGQGCS